MNRFLTASVTLLLAVSVNAAGQVKDAVKDIRAKYNEAKEIIARSRDKEAPLEMKNEMTLNLYRNLPGSGPQKETVEGFFFLDYTEDNEYVSSLYLVRSSYNFAARKYYEEYLYDFETGELLFCLKDHDTYFAGEDFHCQQRFYFSDGEICSYALTLKDKAGKQVSESSVPELFEIYGNEDEQSADIVEQSSRYKEAFAAISKLNL